MLIGPGEPGQRKSIERRVLEHPRRPAALHAAILERLLCADPLRVAIDEIGALG